MTKRNSQDHRARPRNDPATHGDPGRRGAILGRLAAAALTQSADAVLALTHEGRVRDANPAACRLLDRTVDDLVGHSPSDFGIESRARWAELLASVKEKGALSLRSSCRGQGGARPPLDVTLIYLKQAGEEWVCAFLRDASEYERLREELKKSKEAAEVSGRAKTAFLASLSHEIRTPMNTVLGLAELLWETPLTPDQRKYVRMLRRAGSTLVTLLNDIQDLSKVEAGRFQLESEEFLLDELLDKTIEIMTMRANEKGLDLAAYIAPDVPCERVGDPNRLQQILVNLISNAIKFTERGEVVLRVEHEPHAEDPGMLRFSVADTGIGVPEGDREAIFESFAQVHDSARSKGSGLGLAIVKQLVALMKGKIWLESGVGQGTIFYFTVPLAPQSHRQPYGVPAPPGFEGLRVLIADANPTHRLIVKDPLIGWGAMVTEVGTAEEAMAELHQAATEDRPYHVLLLDRRLRDLDSFKIAESIRGDARLQQLATIILTSENWADDIARTYDLGVGGYLVKPIRRLDLVQAITIALSKARGLDSTAAMPQGLHAVAQPMRILLVDDSPDNRFLITSFLENPGYEVETAENGEVGVDKFRRGAFDLVLMDLQMPVMDGYAATRAIRQWEQERGVEQPTPIIALTASGVTGEELSRLTDGWTAHLAKPITKKTLVGMVDSHRPKRAR